MKTKLSAVITCVLLAHSALADSSITINNGDDDIPPSTPAKSGGAKALVPLNAPRVGMDSIVIASLPASTSPDLVRSRANAMIGLGGGSVPMDRTTDPAAWHVVSVDPMHLEQGLQWFDIVTTSFSSWLGTTSTMFPEQRGHRLVIHASGNGPVSSYRGTVSTTLTNSGLNASYAVGTNTSNNAEIAAGPNFVLINFGPDRTNNTSEDTITGRYIAGGDDTVYDNGQLPSTISYDWWVRFGATVVINAGTPADLASVRDQFARGAQTLTAELIRTDGGTNQTVSARTTSAARSMLTIENNPPNHVRLRLVGGQMGVAHGLQMQDTVTNAWVEIPSQTIFSGGSAVDLPNEGTQRFYRAFLRQ